MAIQRSSKQIRVQDVTDGLESSIATADEERAHRLAGLQRLRQAKAKGLERDLERLTLKLGAAHPRVEALAERSRDNIDLARKIGAEIGRARTERVAPMPNAWVLHGRVRDAQLLPQPALTVALYDARGTLNQRAGYSCTDETGYFKLQLPIETRAATGVSAEVLAERPEHSVGPVFAHVLGAQSRTLFADRRPQTPAAGGVDYIEIILGEAPAECAPPKG